MRWKVIYQRAALNQFEDSEIIDAYGFGMQSGLLVFTRETQDGGDEIFRVIQEFASAERLE